MTDKTNGNQAMPPIGRAPSHPQTTQPQTLQQMFTTTEKAMAAGETAETIAAVSTIMAQAEAQIAKVIRLGDYAREHGEYIADKCGEYARLARANAEAFAAELIASETRRRDEITKLIGKK
jgi:hypothetical protein